MLGVRFGYRCKCSATGYRRVALRGISLSAIIPHKKPRMTALRPTSKEKKL